MRKHSYAGTEVVRLTRQSRKMGKQVEQMRSAMVWMAYGWIVAAGVFLRAAGWM